MFECAAGLFGVLEGGGDLLERAAVVLLHGVFGLFLVVLIGLHVAHGDAELVVVLVLLLRREGVGAREVGAAPLLGLGHIRGMDYGGRRAGGR